MAARAYLDERCVPLLEHAATAALSNVLAERAADPVRRLAHHLLNQAEPAPAVSPGIIGEYLRVHGRRLDAACQQALLAVVSERAASPVSSFAQQLLRFADEEVLLMTDPLSPQLALARLEAVKPSHYVEKRALLDSVLSGAIKPLKGSYTVWLFDSGGRIRSRQAMPEEAYFSAAELSRLVEALGDDWGLLFVALSYRWIVC